MYKASDILLGDGIEVWEVFAEGCRKCYNIDISSKKAIANTGNYKIIRTFIREYGKEDAIRILNRLFGFYNGVWKGQAVGFSIFYSKMRWLANELLMEQMSNDNSGYDWNR